MNGKNQKTDTSVKSSAVIIAVVIMMLGLISFFAETLDMIFGIGEFIMPIFIILWVVFIVLFVSNSKKAPKRNGTAYRGGNASSPYTSAASTVARDHLCEDASDHRDDGSYLGSSSARAAGHLCDDAEQHQREEADAADTLNDMQEGYTTYSSSQRGISSSGKSTHYSGQRISRDRYESKLAELESLLVAGMITKDEFNEKKREYSQWVE